MCLHEYSSKLTTWDHFLCIFLSLCEIRPFTFRKPDELSEVQYCQNWNFLAFFMITEVQGLCNYHVSFKTVKPQLSAHRLHKVAVIFFTSACDFRKNVMSELLIVTLHSLKGWTIWLLLLWGGSRLTCSKDKLTACLSSHDEDLNTFRFQQATIFTAILLFQPQLITTIYIQLQMIIYKSSVYCFTHKHTDIISYTAYSWDARNLQMRP